MNNIDRLVQAINEEKVNKNDPYRLHYHLMPPVGWLNDPNGLCQFKGTYHIYYQWAPADVNNGLKGWGHYATKDFIHYQELGMPLFPDHERDKNGAYSGSAFVENDKIHYFYTGNVKEIGDYDYILKGRQHNVMYLESKDGNQLLHKECLMVNSDYPDDLTCHVRDPKIYQRDHYYLVLGARDINDVGQIVIFQSDDLKNFKYCSRLKTKEPFGYMWECPDLFELDGQMILLCSPQGLKQEGYLYENIYQNGYFKVDHDFINHPYVKDFEEIDNGFDIYAAQSFLDEKNRRILIGWMGLPDVDYTIPTVKNNWQHALTMPRVLHFKNGHLYQEPLSEFKELRLEKNVYEKPKIELKNNVFELQIHDIQDQLSLKLRNDFTLEYENGLLTITMHEAGYGRDKRHLEIEHLDDLVIYSDTSSLEIFINDGYRTFTTRIFSECCSLECNKDVELYYLDSFKIAHEK